jgi:hypothetical protein
VNIDSKTNIPMIRAKLFQLPTKLPEEIPWKKPGKILLKLMKKLKKSNTDTINPPINKRIMKYHKRFSDWKWIEDRKNIIKRISIEPNVPISKPLPKSDTYKEEEKSEAIKKTKEITPPNRINLSFGIKNLPSPNLDINQKKRARVAPIDMRNPLLASSVTGL